MPKWSGHFPRQSPRAQTHSRTAHFLPARTGGRAVMGRHPRGRDAETAQKCLGSWSLCFPDGESLPGCASVMIPPSAETGARCGRWPLAGERPVREGTPPLGGDLSSLCKKTGHRQWASRPPGTECLEISDTCSQRSACGVQGSTDNLC